MEILVKAVMAIVSYMLFLSVGAILALFMARVT